MIGNCNIPQVWKLSTNMSGRVKARSGVSAAVEQATLSVNERILKECHTLYTEPDNGKALLYKKC